MRRFGLVAILVLCGVSVGTLWQDRTPPAQEVAPSAPVVTLQPVTEGHVEQVSEAIAPKLDAQSTTAEANSGDRMVEAIIVFDETASYEDDLNFLARLGGEEKRQYANLPMRVVEVPEEAVDQLRARYGASAISLNEPVFSLYRRNLSVSQKTARAPKPGGGKYHLWGEGVGVAIVDSGVGMHEDIGYFSPTRHQYDFLNGRYPQYRSYGDVYPTDPLGHGTHVAGVIAGDGWDSRGRYVGLAEGVELLSLRVLDHNGMGTVGDVIAAMDWLLSHGHRYNIKVVNLSLGKSVDQSNTVDPLVLAVEAVWDAGMTVVVAAGNYGRDGHMTISSPANSRKVITVGSLTDRGTMNFNDDVVSSYSSRGPTMIDHVLKPDLVAPGNRIVAAMSGNSMLWNSLSGDRRGMCNRYNMPQECAGAYLELSGTSMAAPMVAGAIALMLEQDSSLTPATVKARLMKSARKVGEDPTIAGAGVLDIDAALRASGHVNGQALSPLMARSDAGDVLLVEDTAELWGNDQWDAGYLWADGYLWGRGFTQSNGYLWADGYLWSNGYLWSRANLWSSGYLWSHGYLWSNGYLWRDAVDNADSLYDVSGSNISVTDDVTYTDAKAVQEATEGENRCQAGSPDCR